MKLHASGEARRSGELRNRREDGAWAIFAYLQFLTEGRRRHNRATATVFYQLEYIQYVL